MSLAYLGSFATRHETSTASLPCDQGELDPTATPLEHLPLLRSLLVVHGDDTVSIVHLIARFFLLLQAVRAISGASCCKKTFRKSMMTSGNVSRKGFIGRPASPATVQSGWL